MIRRIITPQAIEAEMKEHITGLIDDLKDEYIKAGHLCLEEMERAREYINRTFNLTNSKGFAVAMDGNIVYLSDFNDTEGGRTGRALAIEKAKQTKGLSLVVVAGMKYAIYVEAKGYNVYTSAKLLAEDVVIVILKQFGFK